jgi:hypothetical protein
VTISLSKEEKRKEYLRQYYQAHRDQIREQQRKYKQTHKEQIKKQEKFDYLDNREERIKYQEKWNLYHDKQLGTTNFGSNTDLDYEFKKLGLDKYRDLWHASTKEELEKAKKKLNENKHDSQDKKNEFP